MKMKSVILCNSPDRVQQKTAVGPAADQKHKA